MTKDEIVEKMVEIAEKHNMEVLQESNVEISQAMMMAAQVRPQLYKIQRDILETLINNGSIKMNEDQTND